MVPVPIESGGGFIVEGLYPERYVVRGPGVAGKEIDLTNGDIDDLVLEPNQPIELQITVHVQDANSHQPIRSLVLIEKTSDSGEDIDSISAQLVSEGKFRLAVRPGQYEIKADRDGPPYFIKSLTVDGEPQLRSSLDLKGGARKLIELFLSSNIASVDGRVIADHPLENEVTLLVEDESNPGPFPTKPSSPDGQFQFTLLHAGRYRLYAFEEFNPELWGNPELAALLASKSVVLEIKEGQHLHISVPLIPAEDLQAALRKTAF